jgi:predicted Rossmann fold nucleotide-binding protein DprA/Smf involved in DNA uptake
MSFVVEQDVITTGTAAKLTHRAESSVRAAIARQTLAASFKDGRWLIKPSDLFEWDRKTDRRRQIRSCTSWDRAAELLAEYGPMSVAEMAQLLGIHVGNVRKHLAILAKQGRVHRLPDGQWVLATFEQHGAA